MTKATEAKDDDGLPHTLEHLIFLGSLDYPYKGTLDIIANRCLARGTNAWTCMYFCVVDDNFVAGQCFTYNFNFRC